MPEREEQQHLNWKEQPLVKDLSPEHLELLANLATETHFEAREMICKEGESAEHFFLIKAGRVVLELYGQPKGHMKIDTIESGEVLGWSWLVEPRKWHFDAYASLEVEAVRFDAAKVRALMEDDAVFGFALMQQFVPVIMDRLQSTRLRLLDMYHVK